MGVVIEGCLKGISSIGFSSCNHASDADFEAMLPYVKQIVIETLTNGLPKGVCLNVNAPLTNDIKGVRICRQTQGDWSNEWKRNQHPRGSEYFWLTGKYTNLEPESADTDQWALANQYIAVTPIQVDMTAYNFIDKLNNWSFRS
jgi:5'-nucleotidase